MHTFRQFIHNKIRSTKSPTSTVLPVSSSLNPLQPRRGERGNFPTTSTRALRATSTRHCASSSLGFFFWFFCFFLGFWFVLGILSAARRVDGGRLGRLHAPGEEVTAGLDNLQVRFGRGGCRGRGRGRGGLGFRLGSRGRGGVRLRHGFRGLNLRLLRRLAAGSSQSIFFSIFVFHSLDFRGALR